MLCICNVDNVMFMILLVCFIVCYVWCLLNVMFIVGVFLGEKKRKILCNNYYVLIYINLILFLIFFKFGYWY